MEPVNRALHTCIKLEIETRYPKSPKLYRRYLVKQKYKARGGEYQEAGIDNQRVREILERWVQVIPFVKQGRVVDSAGSGRSAKASRPLTRLDLHTPLTLPEIMQIHEPVAILDMARRANKNPHKSVRWDDLTFEN